MIFNPFIKEFPFVRWRYLLAILAIWIGSTAWLIVRFRALGSDSIMYGLPLAFAKGPFSLSVPFLGDFPPYSAVWGHQWPGAMWLRGAIFAIVPFSRGFDISILLSLQFASGLLLGWLVWKTTQSRLASLGTFLIVVSDRVIIAGLELHRFETIAILSLVLLYVGLTLTSGAKEVAGRGSRVTSHWWFVVASLGGFGAACMHPFAMALAGGILGMGVVDWAILRRRSFASVAFPVLGFLAGLGSVALYFWLLPEAFEQFRANLALQNSFNGGTRLAFFNHLRYYHGLGITLWVGAMVSGCVLLIGWIKGKTPHERWISWTILPLVLSVPLLFALTRSSNNNYTAFAIPFAALSCGMAAGFLTGRLQPILRHLPAMGVLVLAFGFASAYPYRWLVFVKSGMPDFPSEMRAVLNSIPPGTRVFIPPALWSEATKDPNREYRLCSLYIASPWETRLAYETKVYAEAKPGDVLIVDLLPGSDADVWGVLPTFERYPPDPDAWKPLFNTKKIIPGAGRNFGYDLGVYHFIGGVWNPKSSPRSFSGR